jgi:hypothetical protein
MKRKDGQTNTNEGEASSKSVVGPGDAAARGGGSQVHFVWFVIKFWVF